MNHNPQRHNILLLPEWIHHKFSTCFRTTKLMHAPNNHTVKFASSCSSFISKQCSEYTQKKSFSIELINRKLRKISPLNDINGSNGMRVNFFYFSSFISISYRPDGNSTVKFIVCTCVYVMFMWHFCGRKFLHNYLLPSISRGKSWKKFIKWERNIWVSWLFYISHISLFFSLCYAQTWYLTQCLWTSYVI